MVRFLDFYVGCACPCYFDTTLYTMYYMSLPDVCIPPGELGISQTVTTANTEPLGLLLYIY